MGQQYVRLLISTQAPPPCGVWQWMPASYTITFTPGGSSGLGDSTVIVISLVVAVIVLCLVTLVVTVLRRKIRNKRPAGRGTLLQKLHTAIGRNGTEDHTDDINTEWVTTGSCVCSSDYYFPTLFCVCGFAHNWRAENKSSLTHKLVLPLIQLESRQEKIQ